MQPHFGALSLLCSTNLVSLVYGSFSRPCPSDLGCPIDSVLLMGELLYFFMGFTSGREQTLHVPIVVSSFGSLIVVFTPVAHLHP